MKRCLDKLRNGFRLGLFLFAFPLLAHASLPQPSSVPGGVAVVPLAEMNGTPRPQAWLGEQPVLVTADHERWFAVVGLGLNTQPGTHELRVSMNGATQMLPFSVEAKLYPEQRLALKDKGKVELSKKNLERVKRELKLIQEYKRHWIDAPDNDLDFILPASGALSSNFGLRRYFNGQPRAPHAGIDLAVDRGTPVKASAAGTVLAADDYFFNGKTVFIDHGNGLLTMYCHLDQIEVQPGQAIAKGAQIGLSGMTGRATGPHLHWSVILNGAMVNPELFVR